MKAQDWIFSVCVCPEGRRDSHRCASVGPARASTVEAALYLAKAPEHICTQIRECEIVRKFVEGELDPNHWGYYVHGGYSGCDDDDGSNSWTVAIGSVHEVLDR